MKKIISVLLVVAFSCIGFQHVNAQGKQKVHVTKHKVFTTPNGKAYAYKGTNPKRRIVAPKGKAVGYKGRNPRKANGKTKY